MSRIKLWLMALACAALVGCDTGRQEAEDVLRSALEDDAEFGFVPVEDQDKLAKIGLIHKNKASNLKSGIAVYINKLA